MDKIKVAVAGVGNWGMNHLRVYSELREADLMAAVDLDNEKLKRVKREYGVETYRDVDKMIKKEKVEAISVVTPTKTHAELALKVLRRNVNVLIEKPFATSIKEALEIVKEAKKRNLTLAVGHIMRYNSGVVKVKELLKQGIVGKPLVLSFKRLGMMFTRVSDIGVVKDLAIHDIDLIRFLLNKDPIEVFAYTGRVKHVNEDYSTALLKVNGNISCFLENNWLSPSKVRELIVTGEEGIIHFDDAWKQLKIEKYSSEGRREIYPNLKWNEPLKEELKHFLRCIREKMEPKASGKDGLIALYIAEKMLESAKTGKVIKLNYRFPKL